MLDKEDYFGGFVGYIIISSPWYKILKLWFISNYWRLLPIFLSLACNESKISFDCSCTYICRIIYVIRCLKSTERTGFERKPVLYSDITINLDHIGITSE